MSVILEIQKLQDKITISITESFDYSVTLCKYLILKHTLCISHSVEVTENEYEDKTKGTIHVKWIYQI